MCNIEDDRFHILLETLIPPRINAPADVNKIAHTSSASYIFAGAALVFAIAINVYLARFYITSVDTARDLFWAQEIAKGRAWPKVGPAIGGAQNLLGPIWFYFLAIIVKISNSLSSYFGWLALFAASKYVLMYEFGRRILNVRFGTLLVISSLMLGVGSYEFLGLSHTNFVEATLWGAGLLALGIVRLSRSDPTFTTAVTLRSIGLGFVMTLAWHAHPTTIVAAPWVLYALFLVPKGRRIKVSGCIALGAALVLGPHLLALYSETFSSPSSVKATIIPNGLGAGRLGQIPKLMGELFFDQARDIFNTFGSWIPLAWAQKVWPIGWCVCLVVVFLGVLSVFWRESRHLKNITVGGLIFAIMSVTGVAMTREFFPFYMFYTVLPAVTLIFGCALFALLETGARLSDGLACWVILFITFSMMIVGYGLVKTSRDGVVHYQIRPSLLGDKLDLRRMVLPVRQQDALTENLCNDNKIISLHGEGAALFDMSLLLNFSSDCDLKKRVQIGGAENPWVLLSEKLATEQGLVFNKKSAGIAWIPVLRVASSSLPLDVADGHRYPPRNHQVVEGSRQNEFKEQVDIRCDEALIVSNFLLFGLDYNIDFAINGTVQAPSLNIGNTRIVALTNAQCTAAGSQVCHYPNEGHAS